MREELKAEIHRAFDPDTAKYVEGIVLINECDKLVADAARLVTDLMHEAKLLD